MSYFNNNHWFGKSFLLNLSTPVLEETSLLIELLSQYNTIEIWDAGFGLTVPIGETNAVEWVGQFGAYDWKQLDNYTLAATPVSTPAGKAALRFSGGQWYTCDTLSTLITGVSHPYWFAAAIENIPRNATGRTLISFGNNTATKLRSLRPNLNVNLTRHYLINDSGSFSNLPTTTGITSGIIIARDDGYTMKVRWGDVTDSDSSGGNINISFATLGADRYGVVPNIAAFFSGDILGMVFGNNILSDTDELNVYLTMKNWAGY